MPSNIFGEQEQPIKQIKEIEKESHWKDLIGREQPSEPVDQLVPGAMPSFPTSSKDDVERLVQEGGDALVSILYMKAIPLNYIMNGPTTIYSICPNQNKSNGLRPVRKSL